jgi:hypothetical protein
VLASVEDETQKIVMLLLHPTTNHHPKLVTPKPTRIIHYVMNLIHTILITIVLCLIKNKISSFDDVNISTLNEPQNIDFDHRNKTGSRREGNENSRAIRMEKK